MNANALLVPSNSLWLGLVITGLTAGCHQPYSHNPYQQGMYYGQPMPQGMPYGQPMAPGQMAPTQMTPGISSVPADNFYTPAPSNSGPGDAPAFNGSSPQNPSSSSGSNNGGSNTVPKYNDPTSSNSPYFEQSSLRPDTFVPQTTRAPAEPSNELRSPAVTSMTNVEPATFDEQELALQEPKIDQVADEQLQEFEPPIQMQPVPGTFQPEAPTSFSPQEPQPMQDPFELAAPPVDTPPTAMASEAGDALEGTVRFLQESNSWVLEFAAGEANSGPFGGQLPLTGKPEVLKSLQNGKHYQLQGFIETGEKDTMKPRFHIQQILKNESPFAQ